MEIDRHPDGSLGWRTRTADSPAFAATWVIAGVVIAGVGDRRRG